MALWQTDILARKYNAISLKSDYQIWMTLLKKAGWRKPAVSICTASVAQLAWLYRCGNHFAELQQVDQIINAELFHWQVWMHNICNCWFIAARGGGAVYFTAAYCLVLASWFASSSDDALRYIAEHDDALAFACLIAR